MPQTVTITSDAYSFDELSDAAKERARDWYRACIDEMDFGFVIEDFVTVANLIGVSFKEHQVQLMSGKSRSEPNIYWSCSSCQGDGACFEGSWAYDATAVQTVRDHAPQDEKLHAIVDELARINTPRILQREPTYTASIKHVGNYYHEHSTEIDVSTDGDVPRDDDDTYDSEEADRVAEIMRDLMRWLYAQLREQSDHIYSDEGVDEAIEANEYMFDEEGNRHAYA